MNAKGIDFPLIGMVDGNFVRYTLGIENLGRQDELLKKLSQGIPTDLLNAFVLPGGKMAHIQTRSDSIICWTELQMLRISTVYTIARDGTRYPVFKPAPAPDTAEHEFAFDWDPKLAGMRLFFTSTMMFADRNYHWNASYLVAKAEKRKELFRPPLPNIFADSRMCLGNDYQHRSACLADAFAHTLAHLDSSKWNHDAMENLTADTVKVLYSFKDNKQVPIPKEFKWTDLPQCRPVNNLNYGELPIV